MRADRSLATGLAVALLCLAGCSVAPKGGGIDVGSKPGSRPRLPSPHPPSPDYPRPTDGGAGDWTPPPVPPEPSTKFGAKAWFVTSSQDLRLDDALAVGPCLTLGLGSDWELEIPFKVAFATARFDSSGSTPPPRPDPNPIPNPNPPPLTQSQGGATTVEEDGFLLVLQPDLRRRFHLGGRTSLAVGAGLGFAAFTGFGEQEGDLAPCAGLSATLDVRVSHRFSLGLDAQVHGIYTDFNHARQDDRSFEPVFAIGLGGSWDL